MKILRLDDGHKNYARDSWLEGAKKAPDGRKVPWKYFRAMHRPVFQKIIDDPSTVLLGAYDEADLLGWLVMTPSRRVPTVHWVHTRFEHKGVQLRRRGIMTLLLEAADLGSRFAYTGHAQHDEAIVAALRARGVAATYIPMEEWLK